MDSKTPKHIVFFHFFLRDGGVEKLLVKLANDFASTGDYRVSFVAMDLRGHFLPSLDARVTPMDMGLKPFKLIDHLRCIFSLARLLRTDKPEVVMTGMPAANLTVILAAFLTLRRTRTVISEHGPTALWIRGRKGGALLKCGLRVAIVLCYRLADAIVTVSDYLIADLSRFALLSPSRLQRIYNPVIDSNLEEKALQAPPHRWFHPKQDPIILSVGRLAKEKNFDDLLEAFSLVRATHPAVKLLLLGDGPERAHLERRIAELGLAQNVDLPGFQANPYGFMRQADMFVLSSSYEGLPTALIEALACGCPAVATDSPGGTAEILGHGRYGLSVPVGDAAAMKNAMLEILTQPQQAQARTQAFHASKQGDFTAAASLQRYRRLMQELVSNKR